MTIELKKYLKVKDGNMRYVGANQYWYKNKFHALSGCGPTSAAETMAYLASNYPDKCRPLFSYDIDNINREDFVLHMDSVRQLVKPGVSGLTSIDFYESRTKEFAEKRGVDLSAKQVLSDIPRNEAFSEIVKAIDNGFPVAMLILRNPFPEIDDFTWHWMNIIGYDSSNMNITISTYGKKHILDFNHVWHQKFGYRTELIYFWPKED